MSADPLKDLRQCEREIAECAAYEGPDEVLACLGWADWSVERQLILEEIDCSPSAQVAARTIKTTLR